MNPVPVPVPGGIGVVVFVWRRFVKGGPGQKVLDYARAAEVFVLVLSKQSSLQICEMGLVKGALTDCHLLTDFVSQTV